VAQVRFRMPGEQHAQRLEKDRQSVRYRERARSPAKDKQWWTEEIIVQRNKVTVKIDGQLLFEYTEPPGAQPGPAFTRKLDEGTFALQGHDPRACSLQKHPSKTVRLMRGWGCGRRAGGGPNPIAFLPVNPSVASARGQRELAAVIHFVPSGRIEDILRGSNAPVFQGFPGYQIRGKTFTTSGDKASKFSGYSR